MLERQQEIHQISHQIYYNFCTQIIVEMFGIAKMLILKGYKNPYLFLMGKNLSKTYQLIRKLIFFTALYSQLYSKQSSPM